MTRKIVQQGNLFVLLGQMTGDPSVFFLKTWANVTGTFDELVKRHSVVSYMLFP